MKNYATEMVNSKSFADQAAGRNRYAGRNLDEPFEEKPKRLAWYPFSIQPVKKTVDQYGLKTLGQKAGPKGPQRYRAPLIQAGKIALDVFKQGLLFLY
jgi:hypothetical protein